MNETSPCICPSTLCFGVPGDSDESPQICRACTALDPERDCLRAALDPEAAS